MEIIDTQLHEIGPRMSWDDAEATKQRVMSEVALAWIDAVGVDVALLNALDAQWALELSSSFPDRFKTVVTVDDPARADLDEFIQGMRSDVRVCAVRALLGRAPIIDADSLNRLGLSVENATSKDEDPAAGNRARLQSGYFDALFGACERHAMPLFVLASGNLKPFASIPEKYPDLRLIIDHLGAPQPPFSMRDERPWSSLSPLLALARHANVAVKMCGAPALSDEAYPFADVWAPLRQLLEAYGAKRLMWASDISRFQGRMGWTNEIASAREAYPGRHSYAESLFMIRDTDALTEDEKEWVLGRAARELLEL